MKAAFAYDNRVVIKDIAEPKVGSKDILVKMRACGICGSDVEKVYGRYGVVSRRLGHEPSGEVIAVGEQVKDIKVGDRVFVHHHVPCYDCHYCKHGDYTMCDHYQRSNIDPCGLAEVFLVPEWNIVRGGVLRIPDHVSYEEAAMIEPLACCIRAIDKANIIKGDSIAIIGIGPAGMMLAMLARLYGAESIYALDINRYRLEFAKRYVDQALHVSNANIIKSGIGVDAAIVATGNPKAFMLAMDIVRRGGKVILFGVPAKDTIIDLDLNKVFTNEIKIIPSLAASDHDTKKALDIIANNRIDVKSIITHRFRLEESNKAFEVAHRGEGMKIVIID